MERICSVYILDVPYSADRPYSYSVPSDLYGKLREGTFVEVPFGRGNRPVTGLCASVSETSEDENGLKAVVRILEGAPVLDGELLGLCGFLRDHTLCTMGDAVRTVVPPGAFGKVTEYYSLSEGACGTGLLQEIREAFGNRRFTKAELSARLGRDVSRQLSALVASGELERSSDVQGMGKIKKTRVLSRGSIPADPDAAEALISGVRGENRKKILRYVAMCGEASEEEIAEDCGISKAAVSSAADALAGKGYLISEEREIFRNRFTTEWMNGKRRAFSSQSKKPALSEAQEKACGRILEKYIEKPCAVLLHGVTGSGKTNVMLEVIDRALEEGRGVIMLVPEIALTPQAVLIFLARYGERVAVIHSALSQSERYDAWRRIREGEATLVIGTRSAIFAPVKDLGLILIDEEQEYTYKSDTNPKYYAHDVASYRCGRNSAMLLLASATPSVVSYYKAKSGKYTLVELKERYGDAKLPDVVICDMREELQKGNLTPVGSVLARRLISDHRKGNQSILFLNRRGYNNYVSCRSCGKSIKCPNCSVTLTYHSKRRGGLRNSLPDADEEPFGLENDRRSGGYLVCHTCGYKTVLPKVCPECGKEHFMFMGCGTQKAEDDIVAMFPDLRIARMDHDTTTYRNSHEEILDRFRRGDADVLLGTQMVTKGHDFPKVATVGVLNADGAFMADDYRAGERTFSMITQVIGRAGRADTPGFAVIQTYNPENRLLYQAAGQNYEAFYEEEIKLRKALKFPPFCDIAVLTLSSPDEGLLGRAAAYMYGKVVEAAKNSRDIPLILFGPFEAPVYRVSNTYRMRLVMKCSLGRPTRELLSKLLRDFGKTPDSVQYSGKGRSGVGISVDLNPSTI